MEILRKTLKAYILAILLFLLLTFLLAVVINFTPFAESWAFAGLMAILAVVNLILGILEGRIVGKRGILVGLGAGILFLLLVLFAAGGIFSGAFGIKSLSPFYIIPVVAGALGGIFGANGVKR